MTLFVPDISHHQAGIDIQALKNEGAAALIARVGQAAGRRTNGQQYGTTRDREWTRHRDEARRVGLPLVAYWYVGNLVTAEDNAALAASWVGDSGIPWMIDHEDASGSLAFYCQVVQAFRARGLRVILGYVPRWYWDGNGRADLTCGPPLVNSRYSTASGNPANIYQGMGGDTGIGWQDYGGQDVVLWQFTSTGQMAGRPIDVSAFRGTQADLEQLINGTTTRRDHDMLMTARQPSTGAIVVGDGITRRHLPTADAVTNMQYILTKAGLDLANLGDVEDISTLGNDIGTALGALADDETNIIQAVRDIVAADQSPTVAISPEQVQQLADAVVAAVPPQVAEAVRQAFARAGAPEPVAVGAMPNLRGLSTQQARESMPSLWRGTLVDQPTGTTDPDDFGKIVAQSPSPGVPLAPDTYVSVWVATSISTGE